MSDLFREEVVFSRRQKWLGDILLVRPVSLRLLTLMAVAITASIAAFLFFVDYTRKERVTGQLALNKGLIKVYAQVSGIVVRRLVEEGERVATGQTLYLVSVERNTLINGDTQAEILRQIRARKLKLGSELRQQAQILRVEERQLVQKIADLEAERAQIRREILTQDRKLRVATDIVARFRELVQDNFVSQMQLDEKEQDLLEQQGKLENLKRAEISTQRELNFLRMDLANLPFKASNTLLAIERNIAGVEQEILDTEAKREMSVVALQGGTVTAVVAEVGQTVTPAQPMVGILPEDAALEATLYVPSRAVGFVEVGQKVLMRYQAYPYQKFGQYPGTVREIAKTALKAEELKTVAGKPDETYYRMLVALDAPYVMAYGKRVPLQDGMDLEVDILIDTRKLYEWVLEPVYSVTGKL
ncbi:MAG TPA: HlyD family secretion protein [Burkholderiales bacterium]